MKEKIIMIRMHFGQIILLVIFAIITVASFSQQQFSFANPFESSKILLFKDSNDFVLFRNSKMYFHDTKRNENRPVSFNYDSILKVCYKKIYRNNFDLAWSIRQKANVSSSELYVYNYKCIQSDKYIFCRFYTVNLDTINGYQFNREPCVLILKLNQHNRLSAIYSTSKPYVQGLLVVNTNSNGEVCIDNKMNFLLPVYHPGYTSIKQGKNISEDIDDCIAEFTTGNGSLNFVQFFKVHHAFNLSRKVSDFKKIDNVFSGDEKLYAYDSKIPIIYDIENSKNSNLFPVELDSITLLKRIESNYYEIIKCNYSDDLIRIVLREDASIYYLVYNTKNETYSQALLDIPANHSPLRFGVNNYCYALILNNEIKIFEYQFK